MSSTSVRSIRLAMLYCQFWAIIVASANTAYISPEDCSWKVMPETKDISMTCNVCTLQGGSNPTNFSLIMPRLMVKLTVKCDDDLLKGEMVNSSFKHLRHLQVLNIERCKLESLPSEAFVGLSNLKNLTIKTFNSPADNWSLRLSPASLKPLEKIECIDLSENSIEELPEELLCGMDQLRFLNLTRNRFISVASTGFSHSKGQCSLGVEVLDMTHNNLRILSEHSFVALTNLRELYLSYNQIIRVEFSAFFGLVYIKYLDLAHNQLVALPSSLFQSTPRISKLYLRNNSLSALPPGLLARLREITVLDLAHNQLSSLEWLESEAPSSLTHLDLSYNRLTRIHSNAFRSVINIQTLLLQNNLIDFIEDSTFSKLENLHALMLGFNRLKTVSADLFMGLTAIAVLHLENNRLKEIDDYAFKNNSIIQELNLSGNNLEEVPRAVSSLKRLHSLDLSENEIVDVTDAPYQGLGHLHALNLMANRIRSINRRSFYNIATVRNLNLARNRIRNIEQDTFNAISGLHFLRLDSNEIEDTNGLFNSLHDMIMLNISANRLRWFDYALIPTGLQWLDIHDNQIEALGNYFELVQNVKLRTLDASSNRLTDIDTSSIPNDIEVLFLNNNSITRLQSFAFLGKHNLTRVDLTNNLLPGVEMAMLQVSEVPTHRPLPEFAISNNPYLCDCHMDWIQKLQVPSRFSAKEIRQFPRIIDIENVKCKAGFGKSAYVQPLVSLKPSEFLCTYKRRCVPLCHCCEFESCACEIICPQNCTCYHDLSWTTNIVDCGSGKHSAVPKQLPFAATELHFDGNSIDTLTPLAFIHRDNIQVILANQSNIVVIEPRTFASLHKLRVLHLEDNQIAALRGQEFTNLSNLRELYLSNNQLKYVNNVTFAQLRSLEVLHLDRNYLVMLPIWSLRRTEHLIDLRLALNPWTCSCDFTNPLAIYIRERGDTVSDIADMSCVYNETIALRLWELNVTDCHSLSKATSLARQVRFLPFGDSLLSTYILIIVPLLLAAVLVTVLTCRNQSGVGLRSRCGIRMFCHPSIEEEKLFDVFVSYSKSDEDFVAEKLASRLELGKPIYRLCLHHRDLPMTGQYLSEAIREAVESSRKTIIVISESFLKNDWCGYEFKLAHCDALHNNPQKIIIIFVGRMCHSELDFNIRTWIKHSTLLQWGEKDFWNKLRYALPKARERNPLCPDIASVGMPI
ncbi:toll-like receptor Tollo [Varroa jacobsoni]|uniref:toll-like receptor Tollo n=1 Tax=Varroa jacobsoni TaxID=62625 RepID=UPI000BF29CCD|nr:toll-like receptor Tollo [Varroa jacobsoni]